MITRELLAAVSIYQRIHHDGPMELGARDVAVVTALHRLSHLMGR